MIDIMYNEHKGDFYELRVTGHASTSNVCAAVSVATTMTTNAFLILEMYEEVKCHIERGAFSITVLQNDKVTMGLVRNLLYTLESLHELYKGEINYVKIKTL